MATICGKSILVERIISVYSNRKVHLICAKWGDSQIASVPVHSPTSPDTRWDQRSSKYLPESGRHRFSRRESPLRRKIVLDNGGTIRSSGDVTDLTHDSSISRCAFREGTPIFDFIIQWRNRPHAIVHSNAWNFPLFNFTVVSVPSWLRRTINLLKKVRCVYLVSGRFSCQWGRSLLWGTFIGFYICALLQPSFDHRFTVASLATNQVHCLVLISPSLKKQ